MTRLCFHITDIYGNTLPYTPSIMNFEVNGPADVIGENPFPLMGGQGAVFTKVRHQTGSVTVLAKAGDLPLKTAKVEIVKPE